MYAPFCFSWSDCIAAVAIITWMPSFSSVAVDPIVTAIGKRPRWQKAKWLLCKVRLKMHPLSFVKYDWTFGKVRLPHVATCCCCWSRPAAAFSGERAHLQWFRNDFSCEHLNNKGSPSPSFGCKEILARLHADSTSSRPTIWSREPRHLPFFQLDEGNANCLNTWQCLLRS